MTGLREMIGRRREDRFHFVVQPRIAQRAALDPENQRRMLIRARQRGKAGQLP